MFRTLLRASCFAVALLALSLSPALGQEPLPLEGHSDAVTSSAYTPDGQLVITGSYDRTLNVFNAADGALLRTMEGHAGQVFSVAVSPDGRRVLSASRDGTARLWDLFVPTPLAKLEGHEGAVRVAQVAADGSWMLTGAAENAVKLWKLEDGSLLFDLKGHAAPVTRGAMTPDNTQVATADETGMVRLWNPTDGTAVGVLGAHAAEITGLAYHPSQPVLLTSAADGTVKLWTLPLVEPTELAKQEGALVDATISADGKWIVTATADGKLVLRSGEAAGAALANPPETVGRVALSADAQLLAVVAGDGTVRFWKTADGTEVPGALRGHAGPVRDLRFSADAAQLATAGEDGTVRIWRGPSAPTALPGHTMPVRAVARSKDGKLIATAGEDKVVRLFAPDATAAGALEGHETIATDVAFSPDASQVASADELGTIRLWTVADKSAAGVLLGPPSPVTGLEYSADGKTLHTSNQNGTLSWWQLPVHPSTPLAGHAAAVTRLAATPDQKSIVTGSADGSVRVFTATDGKLARALAGHEGEVTALAADNTTVVAGNEAGVLRFWNLADGADKGTVLGGPGALAAVAIHTGAQPTTTRIAASGEDGIVRIFQLPAAPTQFAGSALTPTKVVFSKDRSLMASAGTVGGKPAVVIRKTADGAAQGTLLGHAAAVSAIAFSADNKRVATGSADKTARVWDLTDPKYPEIANFAEHAAPVTAVAFSADGNQVFSGDAANALKQWTVADAMEVRALAGHTGAISALEVAGATLVSGSADQTVRIWNTANGQATVNLSHGAAVTAIAVSADGKQIASGGADKNVKIFAATGGNATATLAGSPGPITAVAFNADGTRVAASSADGLRLWDSAGTILQHFPTADAASLAVGFSTDGTALLSGNAKHVLQIQGIALVTAIAAHESAVTGIAYAPNGAQLFTAGADMTVRRWNVADGKALGTYAGATAPVGDLAISGEGNRLAANAGTKIHSWPIAAVSATPVPADIVLDSAAALTAVALSADGTRLAAADEGATITVVDLASKQVLQRLNHHTMPVSDLLVMEAGQAIASAGADQTAVLQKLNATRVVQVAEGAINDLATTADGTQLVTAGADNKVQLINPLDGAVLHSIATAVEPITVAVRDDKTQVAAGLADSNLASWPIAASGPGAVETIKLPAAPSSLAYHGESGKLAVAAADSLLRIYDSNTGVLLEAKQLASPPTDVVFQLTGEGVVVAAGVEAFAQDLSLARLISAHEGAATGVAFSPDAAQVISSGADKLVRLWNLADGTEVGQFAGAVEAVESLDLATSGGILAAATTDGKLLAWDRSKPPAAGQPATALFTVDLAAPVARVAVSADGTLVGTAGSEGQVQVWEVASGRELQRFANHEGGASAIRFTADGQTILSAGADGIARTQKLAAARLIVADESRVGDVAYLADGSQFVTVGDEMLVKFWNAEGEMAKSLPGAEAALTRLAIRSDATQLAAADAAGKLLIWALADGSLAHTIEGTAAIHELAFSADGLHLAAAAADNHLRVYATEDASLVQDQLGEAPLLSVRFAPGGREIATGSADKGTYTWAFAARPPVRELAGHTGAVYDVAFSPDGTQAVTCGADGTVRVWDLETGSVVKQLTGHAGAVYTANYRNAEQLLTAGIDGTARLWNIASGQAVQTFAPPKPEADGGEAPPAAPLFDATANEQGTLVATAGRDRKIRVFNLANGQLTQTIEGHVDPIYRLLFKGNLLLSLGQAGTVTAWNPANGQQANSLELPSVSFSVNLSPDGTKAVVSGADGKAHILTLGF